MWSKMLLDLYFKRQKHLEHLNELNVFYEIAFFQNFLFVWIVVPFGIFISVMES